MADRPDAAPPHDSESAASDVAPPGGDPPRISALAEPGIVPPDAVSFQGSAPEESGMAHPTPAQTVLGKHKLDQDPPHEAGHTSSKRKRESQSINLNDELLFVQPDENIEEPDEQPPEDSEGDESGMSDADDDEPFTIYDSSMEVFPEHPAFDERFTQVVQDLEALGSRALEILDNSACQNRRVSGCRSNAEAVSRAPDPPIMEIGLFGETGAGKSSLINSLLDMPNLAKAMSSGQSCTFVVTKYRRPFPSQGKSLGVEINYFDLNTIKGMFKDLLVSYNTYTFTAKKDQDWTEDEKQEYKRQSANALKTFRTIFCQKEAMSSDKSAKSWLAENKKTPDAVISILMQWTKEHLEPYKDFGPEFRRYSEVDTAKEYADYVEPLLFGTSHLDEPSLWPLVSGVSVGVRGPVVLNYISIVDLPGLDDTNSVRVSATERQIDNCDGIWILAHIDRAITNTTIDNLLGRYAEAFKGNVTVILTRSDAELTDGVIEHLKRERGDFREYDRLLREERQLRKMKKRRASQVAKRHQKMSSKKKMGSMTEGQKYKLYKELEKYQEELAGYKKKLPEVTTERVSALVGIRNEYVSRCTRQERQDHMPEGMELPVLCVSNYHYAGLKGWTTVEGDLLDPETTGIPGLRYHVLQMVAPTLLQMVEDFIDHKCSVFIEGFGLWSRSVTIDDPEKILKFVKRHAEEAQPKVGSYTETVTSHIDQDLVQPLVYKQQEISDIAVEKLDKKKTWHWGTIRAFFRHYGNHATQLMPKESWNEQFIDQIVKILDIEWDTFLQLQKTEFGTLKSDLIQIISKTFEALKEHHSSIFLPMERIGNMFNAHIEGISQAAKEHQKAHKKGLRNCKLDATQDRSSGYFTNAIKPTYDECNTFHGSGVKSKSLLTLESALKETKKKSPFAIMCKKMQSAITKESKTHIRSFQKTVDNVFADINQKFDTMLDDQGVDAGEDELKEVLKIFIEKAEEEFKDIKMELQRIKRKYEMGQSGRRRGEGRGGG